MRIVQEAQKWLLLTLGLFTTRNVNGGLHAHSTVFRPSSLKCLGVMSLPRHC